jgi:hypothetical protein
MLAYNVIKNLNIFLVKSECYLNTHLTIKLLVHMVV